MKDISRKYVYKETVDEVMKWVNDPLTGKILDRPPKGMPTFPFYLEQYINHLKFKARQKND